MIDSGRSSGKSHSISENKGGAGGVCSGRLNGAQVFNEARAKHAVHKAIGIDWIASEGEGEVDASARLRL